MDIVAKSEPPINEIIFNSGHDEWVMKITKDGGIKFNTQRYPNSSPDDFAQAVIDILERCYDVRFEKKECR